MRTPFRYGNRLFSLAGQLLIFPALKDFIADVFGYGWDRNRAIDSKGNHNNALMGGYLLAASNTVIAIAGILTTDTIKALTKDGFVGSVTVNGTISFSAGNKYGAFEVYRGTVLIGRYCLTERQGLRIINQVTGGLPNGLLGGTTTTVWQRSNAFYSETNANGYSISATGWVTNNGEVLTVGALIPADLNNPTKCMALVSGVQQDLQFVGKAKNGVSHVPLVSYFNGDRLYKVQHPEFTDIAEFSIEVVFMSLSVTDAHLVYGMHGDKTYGASGRCRQINVESNRVYINLITVNGTEYQLSVIINTINKLLCAKLSYNNSLLTLTITDVNTGYTLKAEKSMPATITFLATQNVVGALVRPDSSTNVTYGFIGYIASIKESYGGVEVFNYVSDHYTTSAIDTIGKRMLTLVGISTNLLQNVDLVHNAFNQTGYELWYNGTDYRIYPLSSTGTRIITPAGYTLVETVTAGNMPSVADSRMSTFKYALANSYAVRQSVPEAFDTTDPCAPKLLTYPELSALSANPKVIKTEADGKITNIKIK